MKIDCRNLACPEPVIKTKNALNESNEILEVLLNSVSSVSNVTRFATTQGYNVEKEELGDGEVLLKITGKEENDIIKDKYDEKSFLNKTIFIKDDKIGEGDFGQRLMKGFIKNLLEFEKLPRNIILVNKGVFLTTKEENSDVAETFKKLSERGVNIYSCGLCLEYYNIPFESLKAGEIGNAYDTVSILLSTEVISL